MRDASTDFDAADGGHRPPLRAGSGRPEVRRRLDSSAARARSSGFTLIEIMVVVVLIALTVSLISLNLDRDVDAVARLEAQRFASLVEHLRDESVLTGKVYAIEVDERDKKYRFLENAKQWAPIRNDDVLRERRFPEYVSVKFDTLLPAGENDRGLVVVQGVGDITPFQLVVEGDDFRQVVRLDDAFNLIVDQVARDAS